MQRSLLLSLGALSLISACSSGDGFSEDKSNPGGSGGGDGPLPRRGRDGPDPR